MKRKIIATLFLSLVFSVVLGLQVVATASAETKNGNPLTSPISFFQINGKVTYRLFKFFANNGKTITPAQNVTITAENIFTHDKYATSSDVNGNYTLWVENKGVYLVGPSGGNTNVYAPALRAVTANRPGTQNNINFQGYILP